MKKSFLLYSKLLSVAVLVIFSATSIFAQVADKEEGKKPELINGVPIEYYKPMPLPLGTPRDSICPNPGLFITYDRATKQESIGPVSPDLQKTFDNVPGSKGVDTLNMSQEPQQGRNFGSLSYVSNPEDHPWRVNCKIYMTFFDGTSNHYYVGSGVLIDAMHVLTAGHCVYDWEPGNTGMGWATSITVKPGWETGSEPYGYANQTQLHSWTGWTNSGSWDHDMGVIDLDRPVGALTGWHGYGYNTSSSYYTSNTFNNPGYPAASPYNGNYMYTSSGTFDNVYTYILDFNRQSYGGQSGSGAYIISGGSRYVHGVLSHGNSSHTGDTRMTSNKFGHIGTIISDDTPSTFDLMPMDVTVEPASRATGQQTTTFNYLIHNYSSASWTGSVNVSVYISTNNIISTSDRLVQTHNVSSITYAAKGSVRVNAGNFMIPWDLAARSYYVGVILNVSDYNTGNNDSYGQDCDPLTITEGSLPVPGGFYASDGTYTGYCFVDWNTVSGATNYKVYRNTINNSGSATAITGWITSSNYYDTGANPGTLYYYWVKAAANSSGYASSPFTGYNTGWRRISTPTGFSATDGAFTGYVYTTWNQPTGGNYYKVYRNTVNNSGTASAVSGWISSNYYHDTGATPGVTYYYWVQAAATSGGSRTSNYSSVNSGWRKLTAPTSFTASDGTYTGYVRTTWNTSPGGNYYMVYRNITNNSATASAVSGWQTGNSFNDTGALHGVIYYYWVKTATTSVGARASNFSSVNSGWRRIVAPTSFAASDGTYTGYVRTTWNITAGGNYYRVYRSTTNNSATASAVSGWQSGNTFNDTGATHGVIYYYWVKAAATSGGSRASDFSSYNPGWRRIVAPTSFAASNGTYTGYVRTTWNTSAGGNYYRVYRNTTNNSGTATGVSGWQAGSSFNDTGVTPGVTYYYWVKAAATSGGSRSSDFSSVNSGWRRLSPPSGFSATQGVYNDHINASWNTATGASYYNLYKNTVNNSGTASSVNGWMTSTSFSDYAVTPNQTYYYWVKSATDVTGYRSSSFSGYTTGHAGILDCSSAAYPYCGTPYNGNTSTGVNNVSNYGCIGWTESGPEIVHEIFIYNTGTLTATLSGMSVNLDVFILGSCDNNNCLAYGGSIATYTVTTPGLFYIVVDGYQGAAGSYTLTIDCPPVPTNKPVQNVTIVNGQYMCYNATNTITVAGSMAVPFVVQSGGSADFKAGNKISFLVGTNIMPGAYMLAEITSSYCGWMPAPMVAANNNNIDDEEKLSEKTVALNAEKEFFRVYPNPTTGRFTVEFSKEENDVMTYIQVVDLIGNIVLFEHVNNPYLFEVDLSAYNPGIYIIRVVQGDKAETKKIIKH